MSGRNTKVPLPRLKETTRKEQESKLTKLEERSECSSISQPSVAKEPKTRTLILKTHRKAKNNNHFLRTLHTLRNGFQLDPAYIIQMQVMYIKKELCMHPFSPNNIISRISNDVSSVKADSIIMLKKFVEILETRDFENSCKIYDHLKVLKKRYALFLINMLFDLCKI